MLEFQRLYAPMRGHRFFALLYLFGAMLGMPALGAWVERQPISLTLVTSWAVATIVALTLLRLLLTRGSFLLLSIMGSLICALQTFAVLCALQLSPYAIAILGAWPLGLGIIAVNEVDELFPAFGQKELEHWFEVGFICFAIFISASVVGFILSWYQAVPGLIGVSGDPEARLRLAAAKKGIISNLLIALYYWWGAAVAGYYAFSKVYAGKSNNRKGSGTITSGEPADCDSPDRLP